MNPKATLFVLGSLLLFSIAQAQWQSTTYTLKGGWNAIFLHGAFHVDGSVPVDGSWSIAQSDGSLDLVYIPEPSAAAILTGLFAAWAALRPRRRLD